MAHYWIFRTDNKTGRTTSLCNGSRDTEEECFAHWISYLYGFMDSAAELLGGLSFKMDSGLHRHSFRLTYKDEKDIEYFMLLDDEGKNFHYELFRIEPQSSVTE